MGPATFLEIWPEVVERFASGPMSWLNIPRPRPNEKKQFCNTTWKQTWACSVNISDTQHWTKLNMTAAAAVSFSVLGNQDVHFGVDVTVRAQPVPSLSGDSGQPDAESSVSAVSGHPGEHRAAGRKDEVRTLLMTLHSKCSSYVYMNCSSSVVQRSSDQPDPIRLETTHILNIVSQDMCSVEHMSLLSLIWKIFQFDTVNLHLSEKEVHFVFGGSGPFKFWVVLSAVRYSSLGRWSRLLWFHFVF